MANKKITDLTDIGTPASDDVLEIVDISTNTSKSVKVSALGGGSQTLAETLVLGNITDGENISISNGDAVILDNGSMLKKGTIDAGNGGAKGISQICAVGYEHKWEAGRLYIMNDGGTTIREVSHNFAVTPTVTDDNTKGFAVNTRWILDNGDIYLCTDATTGSAVWELVSNGVPNLQQVIDAGVIAINTTNTSYIQFDVEANYLEMTASDGVSAGGLTVYGGGTSIKSQKISPYRFGQFFCDDGGNVNIQQTGDGGAPSASTLVVIDTPTSTYPIYHIPVKATGDYTIATLDDITGGATNLSYTPSATDGKVNSDTGTDATLPLADATNAGLLSPSEKTLIASIPNINTNAVDKITVKLALGITKGQAVYISSANGTNIIVSKASNTSEAASSKTLGLLETTGVTNAIVNVVTNGLLDGLDTSTATVGDAVWLGTSGNLLFGLANKPYAPAHLVYIGVVSRVSATVGEIIVSPQNGFELNEIHDVSISGLADNNLLAYESATSLWKNKTASTLGIAPLASPTFTGTVVLPSTTSIGTVSDTEIGYLDGVTSAVQTQIDNRTLKSILKDNDFYFVAKNIPATSDFFYARRISQGAFTFSNAVAGSKGMLGMATTAVAGTIAFMRRNDSLQLQGLECKITRKIQFQTNISGQRFFCGFAKGYQFSSPTNVSPDSQIDIVGVCQMSSSTNMQVVHNDASGTATLIDLGSSYPCNDTQYNYFITIEQTTTTYIVTVERVTVATGASISTSNTLSTNIPVYNTGTIQICTWITNNATASIASYLDGGGYGTFKN